jgi:hypothetical protein
LSNAFATRLTTPYCSFVLHNLITQDEVELLMQYGKDKGMSEALITPYGSNQLVPSTTRTNTAAWLDFQQNELVKKIEDKLAEVTGTRSVNSPPTKNRKISLR